MSRNAVLPGEEGSYVFDHDGSAGATRPADQDALAELASEALGGDDGVVSHSLGLARAAQACAGTATPPMAWSRFIAKIALACGRDAYGYMWLESTRRS